MITLIDIQKSISRKLDSKFPEHYIYAEEVQHGLKRPGFFINIMPISTDNFDSYKEKLMNIDIMYFSKKETNDENLIMVDELSSIFKTLIIQDRELTVESLEFRVVDNILHCGFSLNITDSKVIVVSTSVGDMDISEDEIKENLGYTVDTIDVMKELYCEVN